MSEDSLTNHDRLLKMLTDTPIAVVPYFPWRDTRTCMPSVSLRTELMQAKRENSVIPFIVKRYGLNEADARKMVEEHWPEALEG